MESILDLFTTFVVQLFIIVDPLAGAAVFLAITPQNSGQERKAMARRGCIVAFLVLVFFMLLGPLLLNYFGIHTSAVRIGGGILLFVIAIEMLYGRTTGTETSQREERLAKVKEDISITPLAIPLLAGPGAIATVLIFSGRSDGFFSYIGLLAGLSVVFGLTYFFLQHADVLVRWIGGLGMTILTRIMGLVLAFLAVQYVVDGINSAFHMP